MVRVYGPLVADLKAKRDRLASVVFHNCDEHDCKTHGNWAKGLGGVKKNEDPALDTGPGGVPVPPSGGWPADQFTSKGKPLPGTDAWLDAHNIAREVFESRPYFRFEQGTEFADLPAEIQDLYQGEDSARRQLNKVMAQSDGYIMVRKSPPGTVEEGIVPQIRPDDKIVTNFGAKKYRERIVASAKKRVEEMENLDKEGVVALQKERIEKAKSRLEAAGDMTKEKYMAPALERVGAAEDALKEAKNSGDQAAIDEAKQKLNSAKANVKSLQKKADYAFGPNGEKTEEYRAVVAENERKNIRNAERKLEKYMADPVGAIVNEQENARENLKIAEAQLDKASVKYVFPPGEGKAGRVNAHMAENVKRLVEGKGRVYLAMEGNIKEDSLLTAVMAEGDETSAVISVPSVTLWRNEDMKAIAGAHLRGREVVLIPDADGINNPRVRNEARAMQTMLEGMGAKVVVAYPPIPLIDGKPIEDPDDPKSLLLFEQTISGSPTGVVEPLKGVDDYLGVGRGHPEAKGTLGNLSVQERRVPKIDLDELHGAQGSGISTQARPNAEKALSALSNVLGPVGSGRVGTKMLAAAMGDFNSNGKAASRSMEYLEKDGHIKIEHIFDPDELKRGRRVMHPDMTEDRVDSLVKAGVIERPSFGDEDSRPVDLGYEEVPVVTIHKKYRVPEDPAPVPLSSLSSSKSNITKTRIKSLQRSGRTLEDIADMLGVSVSFLNGRLK